jgi:hypothetical protein
MEKYTVRNDIKVMGCQVKTFPLGITEAFDKLYEKVAADNQRSYYGLSHFQDGHIVYFVATEEQHPGEAKKFAYDEYVVEKGLYLVESLKDWRTKLDSIKDIFDKMMKDDRVDLAKQCIEWYKTDQEMFCMMKLK